MVLAGEVQLTESTALSKASVNQITQAPVKDKMKRTKRPESTAK